MVLIQLWRKEELFLASQQPSNSRSSKYTPTTVGKDTSNSLRNQNFNRVGSKTNYFLYRLQVMWEELSACMLAFRDADLQSMSIHMRAMTNHPFYKYLLAMTISFAAAIEIVILERSPDEESADDELNFILRVTQIFLQIFFTVDIICQVISHYPSWESYFKQRWNQYDVILILITWIPILATGLTIQKYLGEFMPEAFFSFLETSFDTLLLPSSVLLRVLRILRLLRLLSWIPELNIIMKAISSSAIALSYVILLVFLFFFHFAIAGVLLFKANDPQHFRTFFRAMVSLFQVLTVSFLILTLPCCRSPLWIVGLILLASICDTANPFSFASDFSFHPQVWLRLLRLRYRRRGV